MTVRSTRHIAALYEEVGDDGRGQVGSSERLP